jgi:hypothetical protein
MQPFVDRRSPRLTLAFAAVLALAAVLAASAAPRAAPGGGKTFHDAVGEVAGAPDIGKVTISQDGEVLTVSADVAGLPALGEEGGAIFALNTDGNATTGEFGGADYILYWDLETWQGAVQHWSGSTYVDAKKARDPSRTLIGGTSIGFVFNLANFTWPKRIEVSVMVLRGAAGSELVDRAPDSGVWAVDVLPAMTKFRLDFAPTQPRAGTVFASIHPLVTLTDGRKVAPKTYSCAALLGGVRLAGLGRSGACRWKIPAAAKGKTFTFDAAVAYGGVQSDFGTWKFLVR